MKGFCLCLVLAMLVAGVSSEEDIDSLMKFFCQTSKDNSFKGKTEKADEVFSCIKKASNVDVKKNVKECAKATAKGFSYTYVFNKACDFFSADLKPEVKSCLKPILKPVTDSITKECTK